jgi:hypothetical protein
VLRLAEARVSFFLAASIAILAVQASVSTVTSTEAKDCPSRGNIEYCMGILEPLILSCIGRFVLRRDHACIPVNPPWAEREGMARP